MNDIENNIISAAKAHLQFLEFNHSEGDIDGVIHSYFSVTALTDLEKGVDNGLSGHAQKTLCEIGAKALSLFITINPET